MWAAFPLSIVAGTLAFGKVALADPASQCPSDDEVESELVRLGVASSLRPMISFHDHRMRVQLRDRDGATLGSREVETPGACRERATIAAVLAATWMGIWPEGQIPEVSPAGPGAPLPATEALPPAKASPPATPTTEPRLSSPRPESSHGGLLAETNASTRLSVPAPEKLADPSPRGPTSEPVGHRRRTVIGLALLGAYDGNALAMAAALEVRRSLLAPALGFVGLTCTTERNLSVGAGVGGYTVPALEAGAALGLDRGALKGELGASARLGLLILRGKNLPTTHATARAIPGIAAHFRLVKVGARFSPYVTVVGAWWMGRRSLTLDDDPARADLPGWDAQLGLGVLWALGG